MREVGIHLEDVCIALSCCPLEPMNVRGAEPELSLSLFDEELPGIMILQFLDYGSSTIRRIIVDHKYMETFIELKNSLKNTADILPFIVGWYDD